MKPAEDWEVAYCKTMEEDPRCEAAVRMYMDEAIGKGMDREVALYRAVMLAPWGCGRFMYKELGTDEKRKKVDRAMSYFEKYRYAPPPKPKGRREARIFPSCEEGGQYKVFWSYGPGHREGDHWDYKRDCITAYLAYNSNPDNRRPVTWKSISLAGMYNPASKWKLDDNLWYAGSMLYRGAYPAQFVPSPYPGSIRAMTCLPVYGKMPETSYGIVAANPKIGVDKYGFLKIQPSSDDMAWHFISNNGQNWAYSRMYINSEAARLGLKYALFSAARVAMGFPLVSEGVFANWVLWVEQREPGPPPGLHRPQLPLGAREVRSG